MADLEIDVRPIPKPDKHPTIFSAFADLAVGSALVVINNHNPRHLRDEFEVEYAGGYDWTYVESGPKVWRIEIAKLASTAMPRVLTNTAGLADADQPDSSGAVWNLPVRQRDLDSNVIRLAPGGTIEAHRGPDIDVLIHVIDGAGQLVTECGTTDLTSGDLVWLPRLSQREFIAGAEGIRYLTVHQRRQALVLSPAQPA